MTDPQSPYDPGVTDALNPANLDGHTIEELSAYLDAERTPTNFSIESSPGCQIALTALGRLRELTTHVLEVQAAAEPAPPDSWVRNIMDRIALEARAGRDIPIAHPAPTAHLTMTEGAVRGMVRAAGDSVSEVIVGRCQIDGDVTTPGAPITITVDISVAWGRSIPEASDRAREAIHLQLAKHTELNIDAIHITVQDVRFSRADQAAGDTQP
ncbi:Asp23/Gls24 family envelope stress response protein [Gryllotalpicola protaetiae]|uniref:Asp23/Gls24 family envelope stress response protein n=1 Tax=Gryllotalpicola protaetiae TaxID=2419771 RepID=A0A387BQ86_9MICO|nr:Asp23/Gls24 family envelope stress response protein [Gryllotalpicola protaetiae]AYG03136.1 Asp23/Gls24 family envelope stress response protein [Gryllotalpicola protaetiae]